MQKVSLLKLADVITGKHDANHATPNGRYRFYTCAYDYSMCDSYKFDGECLIVPGNGANVGEVFYYKGRFDAYQRTYVVHNIKTDIVLPKYLYYHFLYNWKSSGTAQQYGAATNYIKIGNFADYLVSVSSFEDQKRIIAELDCLASIIEKKKQQLKELDNLAQSIFYDMFGDPIINEKGWETGIMKDVAPQKAYKGVIPSHNGQYWLLNLDMVEAQTGRIISEVYFDEKEIGSSTTAFNEEMVLYSKLRPYLNKVVLPTRPGFGTSELVPLLPEKSLLNRVFLAYLLRSHSFVDYISLKVAGAKMPRVSLDVFRRFLVILPPLDLQNAFAQKIEAIEKQKELIKKSIQETKTLFNSRMDYWFN